MYAIIRNLHFRSLDTLTKIQISVNQSDFVRAMVLGNSSGVKGVWLSIDGSPVLQLWDVNNAHCLMMYDVTKCEYVMKTKVT